MGNSESRQARNEEIAEASRAWNQDYDHGYRERYNNAYRDAQERYDNTWHGRPNNQSDPHLLDSLHRREKSYYPRSIEEIDGWENVPEPYEDWDYLVEEHYSERGRLALAGAFPNICDAEGDWPFRPFEDQDIDLFSRIIRLEPFIGSSGDGDYTQFPPGYSAPVRAGIRSILTPQYSTLSERYATHFRIWFVPEFRSQLFQVIEELLRDESAAYEIQNLRRNHLLSEDELAGMDPIFVQLENYLRTTLRNNAQSPYRTPRTPPPENGCVLF